MSKRRKRSTQRPRSVTMLAWLQVLQSLGLLGYGALLVVTSGGALGAARPLSRSALLSLVEASVAGTGLVLLGLLLLVVSFALFRLRGWAWLVSMTLQGLGLLGTLIGYFRGRPLYPAMLVGIVAVLHLNQQEVLAAFREKRV